MNDEPRRDAKEIFLQAVEKHAPAEWDAYADRACGDDEALRRLVAALLKAHREKDSVFDDATVALHQSLGGLSRISLREAGGDESPLATSTRRGTREPPPERVGRYRIEGEIARGGVGAVYKAHDDDLGRSLAVKLLLDDHRRNPEMLRRFMEEAQIGGQLQHPGIVPVHDVGLFAAEKPYFAMKLIKGQTLAKLLEGRRDAAQDRQRFLGILEHVAETIAYAHARGVIHRDLKPSNVMIGSFGEVQVVDWGLAKVLARGGIADDGKAASETAHTAIATVRSGSAVSDSLVGSVLGTPAYMPPEQASGDIDALDERSDVFGLGALLCEILTGKPPYVAGTARELLNQAKKGYLEDAWERLDACGADREITGLARRCLAFEPRGRPPNAGAVAKEVRDYQESLEARTQGMKIRTAKARLRTILALWIFVALALGGGATVWLKQELHEKAEQATRTLAGMVAEARELKGAATAEDPADHAAWSHALDVTRRAALLVTPDVDADTRRSFESVKAEIEAGHRKSLFLSHLEDLRDVPLDLDWETLAELDTRYADALKGLLGRDLEAMEPADGGELIRAHPVRRELIHALTEWIMVRYLRTLPTGDWGRLGQEQSASKLNRLLRQADDSPTRAEFARLTMTSSRLDVSDPEFIAFVDTLSIPRLLVLARAVTLRSDHPPAETCLRTALRREPGSYRVNYALGRLLRDRGKLDEALRYALAACSLRSDRPRAWWSLGTVLEELRDFEGALDAYTQAAILDASEADYHEAIRRLVSLDRPGLDDQALQRALASPVEARRALDVLLYESIDEVQSRPEVLIEEGALWHYHAAPGRPSPGEEWTAPDFDDSAWPEGKSGFGFGDGDDATTLTDMWGNFTAVAIRRALDLPDPSRFERLELALRVDDGCVAYLNGELLGRVRVSPGGSVEAASEPLTEMVFELPLENLRPGRNLIAIEGFNRSATSSDFSLIPVVRGELTREAARASDRERFEAFRERASGDHARARTAYFEGRILERAGRDEEARRRFAAACRADPDSELASYTLLESLLAAESRAREEADLGELFVRSSPVSGRFWRTGLRTVLAESDEWTPRQLLALVPTKETGWTGVRHFLETLAGGEPFRINCGGKGYVSPSGALWHSDRLFDGGRVFFGVAHETQDDRLYASARWFQPPQAPRASRGAYRLPMPAGVYRVTLHFVEMVPNLPSARLLDVVIEGRTVLSRYRLAEADVRSFDVRVDDRVLDIEFGHRDHDPTISGLELRRIE